LRHAGPEALARLEPLVAELRGLDALEERRPGIFYLRSRAFLHFHEDPAGLFADLRVGAEWLRLPVEKRPQQRALLRRVGELLRARARAAK
jgi:hypothetical protein